MAYPPKHIFVTVFMLISMLATSPLVLAEEGGGGARASTTDRTVLGEMFTATWCGPCVDADAGMSLVLNDSAYFPDRYVLIEWHSDDNYSIPEESARASMYMVSSIPTVVFDGDSLNAVSGDSGTPEDNAKRYRDAIDARPISSIISVSITTTLDKNGAGHISVDVEVLQDLPFTASSVVVNAVVVEDENIMAPTGHFLRMTARAMPLNEVTLSSKKAGAKETKSADYVAESDWDLEKLGIVAWVQADTLTNKEVYQSAFIQAKLGAKVEGAPIYIGGDMNFSMNEDSVDDHIRMSDLFKDPNNDPLEFSVVGSAHLNVSLDKSTTVVTVRPLKDWFGTETIILKASNVKYTTSAVVAVTVEPVEDPPAVIGSLETIVFDEDRKYTTKKSLDDVFSDPDGEALTFSPSLSTDDMEVALNKDNTLTFVPKPDWNGVVDLEVKATDGVTWVEYTTTIEVKSVNDQPRITLASPPGDPVLLKENEAVTFLIEFEDPDTPISSVDVTWKLDRLVQSSTNTIFTYKPDYDSAGLHELTVRLADGVDETIRTFNIMVENVNRLPKVDIVTPDDNERFTEGSDIYLSAEGKDDDTGDEKDLKYEWTANGIPLGEGKEIYATLEVGTHEVEVKVTDPSGDTAKDSITVVVLEQKKKEGMAPFADSSLIVVAFVMALVLVAFSRKRAC